MTGIEHSDQQRSDLTYRVVDSPVSGLLLAATPSGVVRVAFESEGFDDVLDEADPIDGSYTLEVSSPGIERALTRDWHFEALMGQQLLVRLIRPVEGVRDFIGTLTDYRDGTLTLLLDEKTEMNVERGETAFIRLYNDFSGGVSK